MILFIDDLHATDETSLQLFHYLAWQTQTAPVILLATYRSDIVAQATPLSSLLHALYREHLSETLYLPPLSESAVASIVAHLLHNSASPKLLEAVSAITEGNPFSLDVLQSGERVVDVGCGAGLDSLIAARMVGSDGSVIGVDMTPAMLEKARRSALETGNINVEFRQGLAEHLPVSDGWADVVISNGVLNLMPDKHAALREMARVLKPGGAYRLAIF